MNSSLKLYLNCNSNKIRKALQEVRTCLELNMLLAPYCDVLKAYIAGKYIQNKILSKSCCTHIYFYTPYLDMVANIAVKTAHLFRKIAQSIFCVA